MTAIYYDDEKGKIIRTRIPGRDGPDLAFVDGPEAFILFENGEFRWLPLTFERLKLRKEGVKDAYVKPILEDDLKKHMVVAYNSDIGIYLDRQGSKLKIYSIQQQKIIYKHANNLLGILIDDDKIVNESLLLRQLL